MHATIRFQANESVTVTATVGGSTESHGDFLVCNRKEYPFCVE